MKRPTVHFQGDYNQRTACGRTRNQQSTTTSNWNHVTCPRCKDALARHREATKDYGNFVPDDDRVTGPHGDFRIHRNEGKMKIRLGDLRSILAEARRGRIDTYVNVLSEAEGAEDTKSHVEGASGDSLDTQVDRYLIQYENDAKKTDNDSDMSGMDVGGASAAQMESMDWRDLVKGVIIEAGQADKDSQDPGDAAPGADEMTGEDPDKLGLDHIDVAKFVDDVVRLIENYDSLLEVRSTLMRRARSFLQKNYDDEVVHSFEDVLRDDHGMEIGKDKGEVDADRFPAPAADRASGSAEPGPGGGGGAP